MDKLILKPQAKYEGNPDKLKAFFPVNVCGAEGNINIGDYFTFLLSAHYDGWKPYALITESIPWIAEKFSEIDLTSINTYQEFEKTMLKCWNTWYQEEYLTNEKNWYKKPGEKNG